MSSGGKMEKNFWVSVGGLLGGGSLCAQSKRREQRCNSSSVLLRWRHARLDRVQHGSINMFWIKPGLVQQRSFSRGGELSLRTPKLDLTPPAFCSERVRLLDRHKCFVCDPKLLHVSSGPMWWRWRSPLPLSPTAWSALDCDWP